MKLSITREVLTSLLATAQTAVSARPKSPILGCVLIEAHADGAIVFTGIGEQVVRIAGKATVAVAGSIAIPGKKAVSIFRSLPAGAVSLETKGDTVEVKAGGSRFTLKGMAARDFPTQNVNGAADSVKLTIGQGLLKRTLAQVSFAMSSDENRFILNGVFFKLDSHQLTLVATDGRRLAVSTIAAPSEANANAIVPAKSVGDLFRHLQDDETLVTLSFEKNRIIFDYTAPEKAEFTALTQVSPLVEGNYPNFRQVIPKESAHSVRFGREALLASVQRTALVVSDKNPSVKVTVAENQMRVAAESAEHGNAGDTVAVEFDKDSGPVAYNPAFLVDALKATVDDTVTYEWKDEMSPGVFRYSGDALCVVMPQRLG